MKSVSIGWRRENPEGGKMQIRVSFFAREIQWRIQRVKYESWEVYKPEEEDWEELERRVERRIQRGELLPEHRKWVRKRGEK